MHLKNLHHHHATTPFQIALVRVRCPKSKVLRNYVQNETFRCSWIPLKLGLDFLTLPNRFAEGPWRVPAKWQVGSEVVFVTHM